MRTMILLAVLFVASANAFANPRVTKVDVKFSSPTVTSTGVDKYGGGYTPQLRGYLTQLYLIAPDFAGATSYTLSLQSRPESLPLYTTALLDDNSTKTVAMSWPGVPLFGPTRVSVTLNSASTTSTAQTMSAYLVYNDTRR